MLTVKIKGKQFFRLKIFTKMFLSSSIWTTLRDQIIHIIIIWILMLSCCQSMKLNWFHTDSGSILEQVTSNEYGAMTRMNVSVDKHLVATLWTLASAVHRYNASINLQPTLWQYDLWSGTLRYIYTFSNKFYCFIFLSFIFQYLKYVTNHHKHES